MDPSAPIAFWLVPAANDHWWLTERIDALAAEFGATPFEPHVTLHVGRLQREDPATLLQRLAVHAAPLALVAGPTGHSEQFFKTLFVEFDDPRLLDWQDTLRAGLSLPSAYRLRAHLSLLYANLPPAVREPLARRERLDGRTIVFDTVVAVRPAFGHDDLSEISGWDTSIRRRVG